MDWIILVIAFILGAISMFILVCIGYSTKQKERVNKIHFYVARDKDGTLYLYIGKPFRGYGVFYSSVDERFRTLTHTNFKKFGLNPDDFKDLKWEDDPVEVFITMEDCI